MINVNDINFKEIFDNLFTEGQLEVLECLRRKTVNTEKLKNLGNVDDIFYIDNEGFYNRAVDFESFDGQHSFSKNIKYNNKEEYLEKVKIIDAKLDTVVKNEDFKKAAELKKLKLNHLEQTDI